MASKLGIIFDLSSSTTEAQTARSVIVANNVTTIVFWANGQVIGGSDVALPSNAKINALVFGV